MKYSITTYTINTFYDLYKRGQIKVDADFQRGQVWTLSRKKKFIDTILRRWPFPPIQILEFQDRDRSILDGVQRATTIIDFIENKISIDSRIAPLNDDLNKLNSLKFKDIEEKANYDKYYSKYLDIILNGTVTIFQIYDASTEEIAELFYRFNSPMLLSITEKRNAFIGPVKDQIFDLINFFEQLGASQYTIGVTNRRNLYEDPIVKLCYTIEHRIYNRKISSEELMNVYRHNNLFSPNTIDTIKASMVKFMRMVDELMGIAVSTSSLFSVLLFICINNPDNRDIVYILNFVDQKKNLLLTEKNFLKSMYYEYSSYATTDVKSIQIRQLILFLALKYKDTPVEEDTMILQEKIMRLKNYDFDYFENEFK